MQVVKPLLTDFPLGAHCFSKPMRLEEIGFIRSGVVGAEKGNAS
jgi:hypothetical protein